MTASYDKETLAFYGTEAPVYVASGDHGESRHIHPFLAKLAEGASILELGCGGGRDSHYMMKQGFKVTPTDGTPEIASQAGKLLEMPVELMRFDELADENEYDGIWAAAALLHVPRDGLSDILGRIWQALKPGGWHGATYKGGGKEGRDKFDRYFNYPSAKELEEYYRKSGPWTAMEVTEGTGGGYDGKQGPWVNIIVQKPA